MFMVTHAAVGVLAAELFPQRPFVAFALGFSLHLLMDIIPHGDTQLYKGYVSGTRVKRALAYVSLDAIVTLFFALSLFNTPLNEHRAALTMGIVGGVLPDLLVALFEVFRIKSLRRFHRLHFFFHNLVSGKRGDVSFAKGFAMQLVLLVVLLGAIVR